MRRIAFIAPGEARALVGTNCAVIDARRRRAYAAGHLPGAQRIDWMRLRAGRGRDTRITDDDARLERALERAGVAGGRPALVYGDGRDGSGEEGRIAWTLALAGVGDVYLLDGGLGAWRDAHLPVADDPVHPPACRLRVARDPSLRATGDDVAAALGDGRTRLVDVRSEAEWNGARPKLAPRGGRIPGAVHYEWTRLFDGAGRLRDVASVTHELGALGVGRGDRVIVYCAGGLRAAFAWAALRALGFSDVRLYDGSFLEWARDRRRPIAHETRGKLRPIAAAAAAGAAVVAGAWLLGSRDGDRGR